MQNHLINLNIVISVGWVSIKTMLSEGYVK